MNKPTSSDIDQAKLLSKACGLYGYSVTDRAAYTIIKTHEMIQKIGDQFSIMHASDIMTLALKAFPEDPPDQK